MATALTIDHQDIAQKLCERFNRAYAVASECEIVRDVVRFTARCMRCIDARDREIDGAELQRIRFAGLSLDTWVEMRLVETIHENPCTCLAEQRARLERGDVRRENQADGTQRVYVIYGEHFTAESARMRQLDAAAFVKKAIGTGTVRSDEEHQADFEGEEPTHARERIDGEQEAEEGQGQEGVKGFGSWTAGYLCNEAGGPLVGFDPGTPFEVGATDDMVIAYVGQVKRNEAEQSFVDHHLERIKRLEEQLAEARMEIIRLKGDHQRACETIAAMHMEAVGEVRGPIRGVITDVADLRRERDELRAQVERMVKEKQPELRSRRTVLVDIDVD